MVVHFLDELLPRARGSCQFDGHMSLLRLGIAGKGNPSLTVGGNRDAIREASSNRANLAKLSQEDTSIAFVDGAGQIPADSQIELYANDTISTRVDDDGNTLDGV